MKMTTAPRLFHITLLLLLSLFSALPSQAQGWKVAIVLPLTGPRSPIGEQLKKGYQLALKEAREKGIETEVLWIDEKLLKGRESQEILSETLQDPSIPAVIGAYSSHATFTLAGMAERIPIPLIIPSSMADRLTRQGYQWVFRVSPSSDLYLKGFVSFLLSLFPSSPSTALIFEDTPWGQDLRDKLSRLLKTQGVNVLTSFSYTPGGNHYPQILESLEEKKPSLVILLSSAADTEALYRSIREKGLTCLVATCGLGFSSPSLMEKRLPHMEGLLFPTPWIPQAPWPGNREFVSQYSREYGDPPDYHAAEAYASLSILLESLKKAHCSSGGLPCRKRLQKILEKGTFTTPLGPIRFISREGYTHQNFLPPLVIQIQGGKPKVVYPPQGADSKVEQPDQGD